MDQNEQARITIPGGEIGNLSVECLPLLTPTTLRSCKFGLCSLCRDPIVAFGYLKVLETPLELLVDFDGLRMRNDLTRVPLLSSLDARSAGNDSGTLKSALTLTRSWCAWASDSRDNLSSATFFSAAVMSAIVSSKVFLSACHSSRALSNSRFNSASDVLVCSSSCSTFFRVF